MKGEKHLKKKRFVLFGNVFISLHTKDQGFFPKAVGAGERKQFPRKFCQIRRQGLCKLFCFCVFFMLSVLNFLLIPVKLIGGGRDCHFGSKELQEKIDKESQLRGLQGAAWCICSLKKISWNGPLNEDKRMQEGVAPGGEAAMSAVQSFSFHLCAPVLCLYC